MIGKRHEPKDILALEGIPANEALQKLEGGEITRDDKTILKIKEIKFDNYARVFVYSGEKRSHEFIIPYTTNLSFYGSVDRLLTEYSKNPDLFLHLFPFADQLY